MPDVPPVVLSSTPVADESQVSRMPATPAARERVAADQDHDAWGHLVDGREHEEEHTPAEGELPPTLVIKVEDAFEHVRQQRLAEGEAAEQNRAEERVHDGRLQLDEEIIVQGEREAAERAGVSRFMTKPFSNADMLASVRALAGR